LVDGDLLDEVAPWPPGTERTMELQGRTAVVTGAASGIGLALTERFVAEGMAVVMADVEEPVLEREASRLREGGAPVVAVTCDVSDADQVDALRDRALAEHGAVHVLCNNAGVGGPGRPTITTEPAVWDWVIGVNVLGPAYGVSAFAPVMVEQGEGHIVNTASEAGLVASPILGSYHVSKYAVVGLSEAMALELAGTGVGVTCVCPELVDTKIFESTRNAPPSLGLPPPPPMPISTVEQWMGTVAMPPADVAADVVYAIRANRFWVLTHQVTLERVRRRNADLEAGRVPGAERSAGRP
jgi:NAD(P)-dependent dehydrogenase (short-subunit alcohol dehydrogenase family)